MNYEEHFEFGNKLKELRFNLLKSLDNFEGSKKELIKLQEYKAITHLDRLRCIMDEIAAKDLGDNFKCSLYYGGC
jgi:hypothetical protein